MYVDRVEGRADVQWALWLSSEEFHDVHHALRMLMKSWLPPKGEERERLQASADALWAAHCGRIQAGAEDPVKPRRERGSFDS